MKKPFTNQKAGFICRSLLWSLLLYACAISICNWHDISCMFSKNKELPVAYSNRTSEITSVRISLDSLQKRILIADGVWQHLRLYLYR